MSERKRLSPEDRRTYRIIVTAFLLICTLVSGLCFQYYGHLQNTVKSESAGYMQEISKKMGALVSKTIDSNFVVLETIATVLQNENITSQEKLQEVLYEQRRSWDFHRIVLIDENGVAYDSEGNRSVLSGEAYVQEVIMGGTSAMTTSQFINGEEYIVFAIPFHMEIDGLRICALAADYNAITFDRILSMTAFDGMGYAHIVRKDGSIVIRSSSKNAGQTGYNILNSLSEAQMEGGSRMDQVRADMAVGKSGQIEYTLGQTHDYMTYMPLETEDWYLLNFVPVSVVNAKSQILLRLTLLMCGVITLSFSLLIVFLLLTFYRYKRRLEQIAYVDDVTGGNTIQRFYELAQKTLEAQEAQKLGSYAVIYTNIEKFKVLNEKFGRDVCDEILCSTVKAIGSDLGGDEHVGRLFADNFCVLARYDDEEKLAARFDRWFLACNEEMDKKGYGWLPFMVELGVYVVENPQMPFSQMIDRAKLSLSENKGELRGRLRYGIYDEQVRKRLFRDKQLEDMMTHGLENGEFCVYLQPKYCTQTEKIGGAEALVRWMSATEGMIYPDEFITLFEKNGFIMPLDMWVFEEVCRTIRGWLDAGRTPIKISVNCSRVHLKNPRFLENYMTIVKKYQVPPSYIEIELTENTVFEDVEYLTKTIEQIHEAGFGCSIDDFGSGYSSLNMIQDIPVDTLKLDKIFFRPEIADMKRSESVVGSIISMSKALSMKTVAEGVEQRRQVDMLKRLDCDYIQGYFFARPMPISEFEQLFFAEAMVDSLENHKEE